MKRKALAIPRPEFRMLALAAFVQGLSCSPHPASYFIGQLLGMEPLISHRLLPTQSAGVEGMTAFAFLTLSMVEMFHSFL